MPPGTEPGPTRASWRTLLRQLLAGQDRQNELLEELLGHFGARPTAAGQRTGPVEAGQPATWRGTAAVAAEALGKVQTEFLDSLTQEITENYETLLEGDFMLNEFVDRFGPRMAHLNGLLAGPFAVERHAESGRDAPNSP